MLLTKKYHFGLCGKNTDNFVLINQVKWHRTSQQSTTDCYHPSFLFQPNPHISNTAFCLSYRNNIPNISAQPLDLTYGKSTVSVVLVIPFASIKEHQRIGSYNMRARAAHHGKLSPSRDASVIVLSSDEASPTSLTQPSTSKWLVEAPIRQPGDCFSAVSAQKCIFIHTQ